MYSPDKTEGMKKQGFMQAEFHSRLHLLNINSNKQCKSHDNTPIQSRKVSGFNSKLDSQIGNGSDSIKFSSESQLDNSDPEHSD